MTTRPNRLVLALLSLSVAVITTGGTAWAGEPKDDDLPVLEDPSMDRVYPQPGALKDLDEKPDTKVVKKLEDPKPTEEDEEAELAIAFNGRVTGWADFMLNILLDTHPGGYLGGGAGVAIEYGPPKSWQVVLEIDWTKVGMPNYNYREKGVPPQAATYAEIDWHLVSVDISYQGLAEIVDGFYFLYRFGAGLGGLAGTATRAEVLPTCTAETLSSCPHWRTATNKELESPLPVIPVLHIAFGFSIDLGDVAKLRVQGGFRNAFYGGLGVAFNL